MSLSVRQTSYRLACEVVRAALIDAVESGPGAVGLVQHRAMAALYEVLLDHPVDRRGRCRSCRRPGAVLGRRRRRCRVHIETTYWLHQPDEEFLRSQLTREFGLADSPPSGLNTAPKRRSTDAGAADDRDDTVALPAVDSLLSNGSIAVLQSPTVSPSPSLPGGFPRAGRPDPDHGAARGPTSTDPRPRRGPPHDHELSVGAFVLLDRVVVPGCLVSLRPAASSMPGGGRAGQCFDPSPPEDLYRRMVGAGRIR